MRCTGALTRFPFVFLLLLFAVVSLAQQGSGGQMGRVGDGAMDGQGATYTHILTPGDSGEWPLNVREGETIIALATSSVFDPALEVQDEKGTVLTKNDDIAQGQQDALILYRFPKAGAYKVLVKGYKSAAGGQYRLTVRRFVSSDARVGGRVAGAIERTGNKWLRFPAQAGQTLVVSSRANSYVPATQIFLPNGLNAQPYLSSVGNSPGRLVLTAPADGDYYLHLSGNASQSFAVSIALARLGAVNVGAASTSQHLEAGGLDIWTFDAKAGDLFLVKAASTGAPVTATLSAGAKLAAEGELDDANGGVALTVLPSNEKNAGLIYALANRTGKYQVAISQSMDSPANYTVEVRPAAKSLAGATAEDVLTVGDSNYWAFDAHKGELLQLQGAAKTFDVQLDLFSPTGERLATNDDGAGATDPVMTVMLPADGRYLCRVSAYGDGGGGSYRITKTPAVVNGLTLGKTSDGSIGNGGTQLWSFEGKAGQAIVLSARSTEFDTVIRVVGPDGLEIGSNDDGGDGTDSLLPLTLPISGTYTVWVTGKGSGKYKIRWFGLDG